MAAYKPEKPVTDQPQADRIRITLTSQNVKALEKGNGDLHELAQ